MLNASALGQEITAEHGAADVLLDQEVRERPLIMVVDDDPQVLLLAHACLCQAGFEVLQASDGPAALHALASRRADLVLCDVVMPGMDGFEVCAAVREMRHRTHVPFVMMTGLDDVESIERAYGAGATEFLLKPLNWTLLPRHVQFILKATRMQEALRRSRERYALAAHGANDGLWDWNVSTGEVFYSQRWNELLGVEGALDAAGIESWLTRIHPGDAERVRLELDAHLDGSQARFESEHRLAHGDGSYLWVLMRGVAVRDDAGEPARIAGSVTDISARKRAQAELEHNAMHDALTDLPNRSLFIDRLTHSIQRARRDPAERCAVLYLDLDRFKVVNDSLGHFAGDRLLVDVSERISAALRSGETLARLGGDEFAVLVERIDDDRAPVRVAERIQEVLATPAGPMAKRIVTSASIGITHHRAEYERAEEMLRDADIAMYAAKSKGLGQVEIFDANMHVRAVRCLEIERDLRAAIAGDQLRVDYQPIVSLKDGNVRGFEALMRWDHPRHGRLAPEEFLDIAVDTGLIVQMGRQVLAKACRQLKAWQERWSTPDWFVSINLSAQELLREGLVDSVDEILDASGLAPRCLEVEVTEQSVIQNVERAKMVMDSLRERGIRMSIDDFGTGFSSFTYLQKLPFDLLKIDRSFVADVEQSEDKSRFLRAIVSVAHQLGLEVIAEGSETAPSLEYLKALRCEYAQGNLLAAAMCPERLTELMDVRTGQSLLGDMRHAVCG